MTRFSGLSISMLKIGFFQNKRSKVMQTNPFSDKVSTDECFGVFTVLWLIFEMRPSSNGHRRLPWTVYFIHNIDESLWNIDNPLTIYFMHIYSAYSINM